MLLEIEDIDCRIASTEILRSCSLQVKEGEIVCLVGRNGAGKSSLLKTIIGLYKPQAGNILLQGKNILGLSTHDRVVAGIAYSPEDSRLFPGLTVTENIQLGFWIKRNRGKKERTPFSLEKTYEIFPALRNLKHRGADSLSGGEKKMVSISRALALDPSLLLLDESFEGLSPVVVGDLSFALKRIKKELRISILLAESNLHNASQVAERTYIIERGEIVFEGHPLEILEDEEILKIVGR